MPCGAGGDLPTCVVSTDAGRGSLVSYTGEMMRGSVLDMKYGY